MSEVDHLKQIAAARALEYVTDGMRLGLGSGTTAEVFLDLLGARVRGGLNVVGVPTSERTAQKARALGIALGNLNDLAPLDLAIDGADESTRTLDLIKGGGGALLREKVVAASSNRMIVIIHGSKLVDKLGAFPLPVEVLEFGHATTAARLAESVADLGYKNVPIVLRRKADAVYKTDNGNLIYDCAMGAIPDPALLSRTLSCLTGVVDHGLYVGIARICVVARESGVEIIERLE
ncbi:MAG TPA: ribose-5-phosphate isomerase RpiA [Rhizomicrobium sp.]|nr:ribose-5-phosphate isomerase RpiA [Rhizomicrobium sp.]